MRLTLGAILPCTCLDNTCASLDNSKDDARLDEKKCENYLFTKKKFEKKIEKGYFFFFIILE